MASMMVNVFDGTRRLMPQTVKLLIRILDGNQKTISSDFHPAPSVHFTDLPFYDNLGDNYTVIVSADGYLQAGFTPVKISPRVLQTVDLMLLPKNAGFNFSQARWEVLANNHPRLVQFLLHGESTDHPARDRYDDLMEKRPAFLAAFLNITTAMQSIFLPQGTALEYFKELIWDEVQQDRFFAYADRVLVDQVKLAAEHGAFEPEPGSGLFHPGATSSYKQVQFGEANVQLTFHENDTCQLDDVPCVKVEADMDYYRDLVAHALLEVIPNELLGRRTEPKTVYMLRWIAGRRAGLAEFDPPYTIEA